MSAEGGAPAPPRAGGRGPARLVERGGALLLLAAAAAPFWAGRFLPLLDLPQHLALAAVVARHGEPGAAFVRYYAVDGALAPYWGYYGAMWLLTRALPLELANRILFSLHAAAVPLAAAYLLASFGRDRRWAAFAVPLVFSTNLFFGFATFLLSVPLFLVALGLTERHLGAARPRARHALPLALAAALVFLCHAQTYLLLGLCAGVLLAVHARSARFAARRALPFLPSLALLAAWVGRSFGGPGGLVPGHVRFRAFGRLGALGAVYEPWRVVLATLPERTFGAFRDRSDLWLGALDLAVFAAALAVAHAPAPPPPAAAAGDGRLRRWLLARRCELLCLALMASYLALPMQVSGMWYLNPRHLVFAGLALPLLLGRPASGRRAWLLGAAAAVALAACANVAGHVRAFQRQVGAVEAVLAATEPGGRLMYLPFDDGSGGPVRLWPLLHFGCYYQVWKGGDVGFSFAGLPSIPVRYRPGMQAPHPYEWRPQDFDWDAMAASYDYFLARGPLRGGARVIPERAEPVAAAGPWRLWRRRDGLTGRGPSSK